MHGRSLSRRHESRIKISCSANDKDEDNSKRYRYGNKFFVGIFFCALSGWILLGIVLHFMLSSKTQFTFQEDITISIQDLDLDHPLLSSHEFHQADEEDITFTIQDAILDELPGLLEVPENEMEPTDLIPWWYLKPSIVELLNTHDFIANPSPVNQHTSQIFDNLEATLLQISRRVNWQVKDPFHNDVNKTIVAIGQKHVLKRDLGVGSSGFKEFGLEVISASDTSRAISSGRIKSNLRSVRHRDWGVVLCFSLDSNYCLKSSEFPQFENEFSRINRIVGLKEVLWSKDKFCSTVRKTGTWMNVFTFPCFVLPVDSDWMFKSMSRWQNDVSLIVKPYKMGGGKGIFVVDDLIGLQKIMAQKYVVQPYLSKPHLLNGKKWDIRTYVLVTGVYPIVRGYLFQEGLVRLATGNYDPNAKAGGNRTQYLTNTSVNRKQEKNMDVLTWTFSKLEGHLGTETHGIMMSRVQLAIGMMLVSSETQFGRIFNKLGKDFSCYNCYHLLGVDLIVDEDLFPRVIEVNGQPSMELSGQSGSKYDATKLLMQKELAKIILTPMSSVATSTIQILNGLQLETVDSQQTLHNHEFLYYAMQVLRESQNLNSFVSVYPDKVQCSSSSRARIWTMFLDDLYTDDPARRFSHDVISKFVCNM